MQSRGRATLGDTVIDFDRMEIRNSSESIPATSLEFRLLKLFIDNPNRVFSRKELIRAVWKKPSERACGRSTISFRVYGENLRRTRLILFSFRP